MFTGIPGLCVTLWRDSATDGQPVVVLRYGMTQELYLYDGIAVRGPWPGSCDE